MTAPPGLVAAALALWGASIGQLAMGLMLGVGFEAARGAPPTPGLARRMPLVLRACGLATLVLLVYVASTQSLPHSLYTWLRWLPLVLLPIPVGALLSGGLAIGGRAVDTTHAYAAIALAAAGTGTGAAGWLYPAFALVAGWALLARQPRPRLAVAAVMFVGAAAIGHGVHTGIWLLQGRVEEWGTDLFQYLFAGKADPFRERTRIGELGRIKLSDRILMRVEVDGPRPESVLLREASYERYRNGEWLNVRPRPQLVPRQGERWILSERPAREKLAVRRSFADGAGLLPLPSGTRVIEGLAGSEIEAFPTGTARVRGAPRFAAFVAAYDSGAGEGPVDARADLEVPPGLAEALGRTIAANGLRRAGPAETVAAVRAFFDAGFAYSLDLGERPRSLAAFLLEERKGHCEYFASATVLLLRALGVPARYAAGYSAQEWSALEGAFVVRERHAHAWAQAHVEGRWIEVDTTPARWAELEGEAARGWYAPLLDAMSWAVERVVRGWIGTDMGELARASAALAAAGVLVAAAVVGWRRSRRAARGARARPDAIAKAWREIEARVERAGHRRAEGETARAWARRLAVEPGAAPWAGGLARLADRYYRARFDPAASAAEAAGFLADAREWRAAVEPAFRASAAGGSKGRSRRRSEPS